MPSAVSSGGFVSRTGRMGGPMDGKTATGDVGPGDYEVSTSRELYPAPAPFHTSMEKVTMPNNTTSAITPGVGTYDGGLALDALQQRHGPAGPTANFSSTTARLPEDKSSRRAVPGPGTYSGGDGWLKKKANLASPAERISVTSMPSAPSIPARNQSYGYEEGSHGALIMQKAPDPIISGCGTDKVGPGYYEAAPTVTGAIGKKNGKAANWGASKAKRGMDYKSVAPGPGTYNLSQGPTRSHSSPIVVAVGGVEVQFGGTSGTAQFASKVPLMSQRMPSEADRTPGPGSYVDPRSIAAKAQALPEELQCFLSTSKRQSAIDPTKSLSAPTYVRNPGPGAYDDPRRSIASTSVGYAEPQPFNTSGQRFGKATNGIPGPGEYDSHIFNTMSKNQKDKANLSKGGVFGTASSRFSAGPEDAAKGSMPGPGNYDPRVDLSPPRHRGDQAAFSSKTDRWRAFSAPPTAVHNHKNGATAKEEMRGDPGALGPGCYATPDPWSKGKQGRYAGTKQAAFGSDSSRGQAFAGSTWTPGPGRYKQDVDINKVYKPFTAQSKEGGFGTGARRFKSNSTSTPGPGQYIAHGDMARKSYNVTYSETL